MDGAKHQEEALEPPRKRQKDEALAAAAPAAAALAADSQQPEIPAAAAPAAAESPAEFVFCLRDLFPPTHRAQRLWQGDVAGAEVRINELELEHRLRQMKVQFLTMYALNHFIAQTGGQPQDSLAKAAQLAMNIGIINASQREWLMRSVNAEANECKHRAR